MLNFLREAERGVIFRMGRFCRVAGPGSVFLIPLVDRLAEVDLDRTIPEWQQVASDELDTMVEFLVRRFPELPAGLTLGEIRQAMYLDD